MVHPFRIACQHTTRLLRATCPSTTTTRYFSFTVQRNTQGASKELTSIRPSLPWIQALRQKSDGSKVAPSVVRSLEPKKASDSFHSVILSLASDPWMGDTYLDSRGHIRFGALLVDLDALAGVIADKHAGPGVTTLTAAFDRITIINPLKEICDLQLSGQVVHATGSSNMEISLQVAKAPKEGEAVKEEDVVMKFACTAMTLDPQRLKPVNTSPLLAETAEGKKLVEAGASDAENARENLVGLKEAPSSEERDLLHDLWWSQIQWQDPHGPKPKNVKYVDETKLQTTAIMYPEHRSRHQFMISAGALLKQTFELASCCAATFSGSRPSFHSLEPCNFYHPMYVGSVLYLSAKVTYTSPPMVSSPSKDITDGQNHSKITQSVLDVKVSSKMRDVEGGKERKSASFHYRFVTENDSQVIPRTFVQCMEYIHARRGVDGIPVPTPMMRKKLK